MASATSKKTELKLVNVACASLEGLLLDYEDFLRQRDLPLWHKDHPQARAVRALAYVKQRSYGTYRARIEHGSAEHAANTIICIIHQATYLINRQIGHLESRFLEEGGFSERLYHARTHIRRRYPPKE